MSINLNEQERRKAAKAFSEYWKDKGYKKGFQKKALFYSKIIDL